MVVLDTSLIIDHVRQADQKETLLMQLAGRLSRENLTLFKGDFPL